MGPAPSWWYATTSAVPGVYPLHRRAWDYQPLALKLYLCHAIHRVGALFIAIYHLHDSAVYSKPRENSRDLINFFCHYK